MANIALLGGGIECLPIIQRVIALGHQAIVIDGNPDAPGFGLAGVRVVASCYHTEQVLPALGYALNHHGIRLDAVMCAGTDAPHVAAAVAAAYRLPGLTPEAAALSVDKYNQKAALRDAGLPVPDFWTVSTWGADRRIVYGSYGNKDISGWDHWHTQSVVKPADSRGARGVTLLPLKPSNDQISAAIMEAERQSPTGRAVIEEYLPGPQLSTESIVVDGRVLFTAVALRNYDRLAEFAPHIIEDGAEAPWCVDASIRESIVSYVMHEDCSDLVEEACKALGWYQQGGGTVKGDLIVHDDKLVILELAARLSGGFLSTHTIPLAYGVPIVDCAIRLALGHPLEETPPGPSSYVCQRYLFPDPADIGRYVVSVPTLTPVPNNLPPGIAELFGMGPELGTNSRWAMGEGGPLSSMFAAAYATYAVRPGDVLRPVTDHGARLGQAIATGSTPEQARARAEAAVKAMKAALVLE